MLTRAARLGEALADRLCREIDAYHDGTVVTKDQVRESCVANLTFVFDSLAGARTTSRLLSTPELRARSRVCHYRR